MLYVTYSKLTNKSAGIKNRENASIKQLNNLEIIENIILHTIRVGMEENKHYKEIYKECSYKLNNFTELLYLTA